jgi:hypothetical protein
LLAPRNFFVPARHPLLSHFLPPTYVGVIVALFQVNSNNLE